MRRVPRAIVIVTSLAVTTFSSRPARSQTAAAPVVHRKRVELIVGGSVLFGLAWLPAVAISAKGGGGCDDQGCRDRVTRLAIPVYGPLQIGGAQTSGSSTLYLLWSLAQVGGIAMVVAGLIGHDVPVDASTPTVAITPTAAPHGAGVVLDARF